MANTTTTRPRPKISKGKTKPAKKTASAKVVTRTTKSRKPAKKPIVISDSNKTVKKTKKAVSPSLNELMDEALEQILGLNDYLELHKKKHVISLHHKDIRGNVIGIAVGKTRVRIASKFLIEKDKGCVITNKGYPTVTLEDPSVEDIVKVVARAIGRAQL